MSVWIDKQLMKMLGLCIRLRAWQLAKELKKHPMTEQQRKKAVDAVLNSPKLSAMEMQDDN